MIDILFFLAAIALTVVGGARLILGWWWTR